MKVIFDLDYTLLDCVKLKEKLAEIFSEHDFSGDYKKYFKDKNVNFNYEKYLAALKSENKIDEAEEKELKLKIAELINDLDGYLFPRAESVLKHFKDGGAELILMTFGDKKWQEEKVKNLSIGKYFDRIIFEDTDKSKSEYLKALGGTEEEVLIINDNIGEAEEMLKILKKGELRLVKGPYNRENEPQLNELSDLIKEKQEPKELNLR